MQRSSGEKAFDVVNTIFMVLLAVIFLYPFLLILFASFTTAPDLIKNGYTLFVRNFSLESYVYLFSVQELFLRSIANSLIITLSSMMLVLVTTAMYAYSLSRPQFQFKKFFTIFLIIPMLFSGGLIPYYLLMLNLKINNTLWVLIVPFAANAWYIMLVKNYFIVLPESLFESAQIEGANNMQVMFKIALPLGFPILATIMLYTAVAVWNSWFQARLFLDSSHNYLWPVQLVVRELQQNFSSIVGSNGSINAEGIKSAATIVSILPILALYPLFQNFFVNGIMSGSVKE